MSDNNEKKSAAKRRKPRAKAEPLKVAAERIAKLLCELSDDRTLFVSDGGAQQERKVDTKALKEFSGVLKEMSAVMNELGVKDVRIGYVGPVIGAHAGPGVLALFFLGSER